MINGVDWNVLGCFNRLQSNGKGLNSYIKGYDWERLDSSITSDLYRLFLILPDLSYFLILTYTSQSNKSFNY